ncbi:MAG TPA: tRNA (adenosine(37)-N6)-dimethylallyltransferase MiaA [Vicinamibacterales bacterium]
MTPIDAPRPRLLAIVGATATGKSALGLTLAERLNGEIISCDSTAVYRGFDIGTDKVPVEERRGVLHHMIDLVEPTEEYSAARYARDASAVVRAITMRGRVPILVGGTGFYYRALTRGLFEGPGRDERLRRRLERAAARRGPDALHRWLARVDAASAARIQPRDVKRLVRALEVWLVTGRPLTDHFGATASPLPEYEITTIALRIPPEDTAKRVAARVDQQFARGLLDEIRGLLARGVPETALPFTGLVYRQAMEHLRGIRGEAETREIIVRENRRYARRQLIWFRKEPNVRWIDSAGERPDSGDIVARLVCLNDPLRA